MILKKFSVCNYKNFKDKVEIDFSAVGNYNFNDYCLKNNVIKNIIICGLNGAGKTNITLAIMDITCHLTDKKRHSKANKYYTNADNEADESEFKYIFVDNDTEIEYSYSKLGADKLAKESLYIDMV